MVKKNKTYKYQIDIGWSQEDDCYVVNVPELKGCKTHGNTIELAVTSSQEACRRGWESNNIVLV
jgi:predicted RNase H-like HicB family nuclease